MLIDKHNIRERVFIIAELSANHNQNFDLAVKTIKAAKEAGADAIKLQTYTADTLTLDCEKDYFQIKHGTIWDGTTLHRLYQKAYTPWDWQPKLKKIAEDEGLICFSSPFDFSSIDFLEKMNVPAYKIASPEIVDIPLIRYAASKMKPIIISTGLATLADIELAVNTCREVGNNQIVLLKCTSAYPTPMNEVDLNTIPNLKETFNTEVGLSDHTIGNTAAIGAVALGARVIEKHFILDRNIGGPDSSFSMEPKDLKELVNSVRELEQALGKVNYTLTDRMKEIRNFTRSLFIVKDIKQGEKFTKENLRSIRPGYGLHPKYYEDILGKIAKIDIEKGTPLKWELL